MASKMCLGCGDPLSFHRLVKGQRGACTYPGCTCTWAHIGYSTPTSEKWEENSKPRVPVISTAPANSVKSLVSSAADQGQAAMFMLSMASKAIAAHRLNKMSEQAAVALANLTPGWCKECKKLLEQHSRIDEVWGLDTYNRPSITQYPAWDAFIGEGHLTVKHVAEIFATDEQLVRNQAYDLIMGQKDNDEADSDDQLGIVVGWRTYNLSVWQGKLRLLPPSYSSNINVDEPIVTQDVRATCGGDREQALAHLKAPKEGMQVNNQNLHVTVQRKSHTCGLYCWTKFEDFCTQGYRSFHGVSANVIPWGTVQMGADSRSLRTSDFLISRLIIYVNTTMVDGQNLSFQAPENTVWTRWIPEWQDPTRVAYGNLCQELANQFQVPVSLQKAPHGNPREVDEAMELEVFQPYMPITLGAEPVAVLPNWLDFGRGAIDAAN